ncbi:peptide-methionine (S)-S-oxide reductase MsrA [Niveibacterium sp. SC-1]|uniref:peptide-methionine (S)-S-oxide reductase MsrA n=1 Tax=Niveibacterium sp. SC-1 TaxID=3135646 RepID=UPI00311E4259
MSQNTQTALLGGGCFWCLEAVFERLRGVQSVRSGYAGGHLPDPSYERVCDGDTGHAEVVEVRFDPDEISYRDLLEVFFAIHDPTTLNRQGNDVGTQYRSVIYWTDAAQKAEAEAMIDLLAADQTFDGTIVTELVPAPHFYVAEDYHQGYFRAHPQQPYCSYVVGPKVAKLRRKFVRLLRDGEG